MKKQKNKNFVLYMAVALCAILACDVFAYGNEDSTAGMKTKNFRGIIASGNIKVIVTKDGTQSFGVKEGNEDNSSLTMRIANKALYLVRQKSTTDEPVIVNVSCRELKSLQTYEGAQIISTKMLNVKNLYLDVHDSGSISLIINAEKVAATVRKNGTITLKGDLDQTDVSIKGNGRIMLLAEQKLDNIN